MLTNIQFLRFVAALMVVFYHGAAHVRASGHELGLLFGFGQSAGFAGVDIFFVISGFIMAWTTDGAAGAADSWSFARRRVARIYSGYWPFFLLALALFTVMGGHYLANAQLLRSAILWPTDLQFLLIPVSWTLIYEMVFYTLFTLLIAFGGRWRDRLILFAALLILGWSLFSHFGRQAYDPGQLETMNVYEQYLAFPFVLEFLAGAMLASWLRRRPEGLTWSLLVTGLALLLAGGWVSDAQFGGNLIQGYYVLWRVLIFGSASIFIVAGLVRLENRGWTVARRFSVLAGGASYAIYLSHTLIFAVTQKLGLNSVLSHWPGWIAQAAFLGVTALIVGYSFAHYRWIERPLHHAFRLVLKA